MKKYEREIKEWTLSFAVSIIKTVRELKHEGVEYSLRDQLMRSGTSIGSNVKEAKASSSRKEMIRYYEIALKSAHETEYWLTVIQLGYEFPENKFESLILELKELIKVLATIILNLKK